MYVVEEIETFQVLQTAYEQEIFSQSRHHEWFKIIVNRQYRSKRVILRE